LLVLAATVACSPATPKAPATTAPAPATTAAATATVAPDKPDTGRADALAKDYLAHVVSASPETATQLGIHSRDAELDDRSPAHLEADAKERARLLGVARDLKTANLPRAAATDVELVESALEVEERRWRDIRPHERQPSLYASPLDAIFFMTARDYAPAAERAALAVQRLEKIPASLAVARTNLAAAPGKKAPPKVWTIVGIEMAKSAGSFFEEQRGFLESQVDSKRVAAAIAGGKKAYAEYAAFLEKDVLPRSNGDFAAGRAAFDHLLRRAHFLDQDADEVNVLGERILKTTEAQMAEVARRIDPKARSWAEVVARVKSNHPTAQDLIPSYRRELTRARAFLVQKDAVPFPPGDDCEVIETPPFLRSTTTASYNGPPPFDRTTKGFFFVTPVDTSLSKVKQEEMLRENDHGDQVDTAVHEAYPGHHLQISFARLHPSTVRKMMDAPTFAEGWGLYSEELMSELGYYTDEERLMQLEWTLVRAARVVIDVGLHTRGMSFDDAVKMLVDRIRLEKTLALSEVKRYTMTPTQPLSYLVGREAIFAMRERYKKDRGNAFTLRDFHGEILGHGTIPVGLISREIFH
jgi:uncharacterized protein (DUF885 family)